MDMAKSVDSPGAREAARHAKQAAKPSPANLKKGGLNIASQGTTASFGNILQQNLQQSGASRNIVSEAPEEKPEESRQEAPREGKTFKETLQSRKGAEERVQERQRHRDSEDDSGSKEQKHGSEQKDSAQHAKEAEQRVVGRQGQGDSGRGSSGQGQVGRQGTGAEQGQQQATGSQSREGKARPAETQQNLFNQAAATSVQSSTTPGAREAQVTRTIPQHIIDQVVKMARLIKGPDGKTEMEVRLHDEAFKGLTLRVALQDGKIRASFVTGHRDIRDLFQQERQSIRSALEEKGLDVSAVDVIMT